ncbi:hypothetical protein EAI_13157 [Harpegnathos saltator]|uniref:Uncharacterized protein n=1 Tax=Harpegnathos saltator TaxID=610380 RepID=E2BIM0_HARSA|nr:hypothetical protein EAI_13157 [Harpegnathos saltator]
MADLQQQQQDEQLFALNEEGSCPSHFFDVATSVGAASPSFSTVTATAVTAVATVVVVDAVLLAPRNFSKRTSSQARIIFSQASGHRNRRDDDDDDDDNPSRPSFDSPSSAVIATAAAAAAAPFTSTDETGIYGAQGE